MYIEKTKSLRTADSEATTTTTTIMEDKFNAASVPPPSTSSSASDKTDNDESSLMDIGNWFMSLSRRRKSFTNKENNQNVSSNLMAETTQTNQSNNSLVNISCSSSANGSSGETGSGLACTAKKITSSKNSSNNILYVLGKCLKLKFRAKQQNDLMSLTSTVTSRRNIAATAPTVTSTVDRCTSNGILNTDSMLQHQTMAISNAYVECPSPLPTASIDTVITSSTVPISTTQSSNSMERCTTIVRPNFNEIINIERESNPSSTVSSIEQAMREEKLSMNAYGWYRGSLSRCVAQKKLQGQPDGSFLIRDSQTKGCNFTLSFRSAGITLHYRIENSDGDW